LWYVRSGEDIPMVYQSMTTGSKVVDELNLQRGCDGVEEFPLLLSLLALFYSKASNNFETASTLVFS